MNKVIGFPKATVAESEDRVCEEADGCPTERAVLQRFWREHQASPVLMPELTDAQIDAAICAWFEYSKGYGPDDYQARMRAAIAASAAQTNEEPQ